MNTSPHVVLCVYSTMAKALTCGLLLTPGSLFGAVLFDNLEGTPTGNQEVGYATYHKLAERFMTDGSSLFITDVTLKLKQVNPVGGIYRVDLYTDNGLPGQLKHPDTFVTSIGSGDISKLPTQSEDYLDVHFGGLSLSVSPNTAYWVVLSADEITENPPLTWGYYNHNLTDNPPPPGADYAYLNEKGDWANLDDLSHQQMSVISAVPEPQEYTLAAALGLLGFSYWRSRRSGKQGSYQSV